MRKTSSTIGLIVMITTLLAACSSPESDGRQTAQAYIQCRETLKADLQKAQDNFVGNFDSKNYQSRGAAFDAYQEQVGRCEKTYGENVGNADRRDAECRQKYVKNETAYDAYRDAVDEGLKDDTIDVAALFASALHAPAVLRAIRQIVPPLPSDEKLVVDLSERAISEGYEDGYFSKNQQWRLGSWRISNIQRINTNQTDGLYTADLKMRLTGGELSFDARVEVTYTLADEDLDWKLDFLVSKGVDIVKTGRYNGCISANIEEDGWGGTQCLAIRNTTDTPLLVGGVRRSYDTWTKFVVTVPALGTATTGGLFAGGSVEDYEIHFVERDFQADE